MCGWETVVLLEKPAASEEAADKGARSEPDEEPKEIGAMNAAIAYEIMASSLFSSKE